MIAQKCGNIYITLIYHGNYLVLLYITQYMLHNETPSDNRHLFGQTITLSELRVCEHWWPQYKPLGWEEGLLEKLCLGKFSTIESKSLNSVPMYNLHLTTDLNNKAFSSAQRVRFHVLHTRLIFYKILTPDGSTSEHSPQGKDHCMPGLQFNKTGFDQKRKFVVIGLQLSLVLLSWRTIIPTVILLSMVSFLWQHHPSIASGCWFVLKPFSSLVKVEIICTVILPLR